MNEIWVEKIDKYLSGEMSREEELAFESELAADKELEATYKLQKTLEETMQAAEEHKEKDKEVLHTLKSLNAKYFAAEGSATPEPVGKVVPLPQRPLLRRALLVAASIIVVSLAYIGFSNREEDTQQMAEDYINSHYMQISPTMGSSEDSLQQGIGAYNNKEYDKALQLFEGVYRSDSNSFAKKYIGLTYLMTNNYDKALQQFEELSSIKGLRNNPGLFLKAATLLQRNRAGDEEKAKQALQQVVDQQADESQLAEKWLKKI